MATPETRKYRARAAAKPAATLPDPGLERSAATAVTVFDSSGAILLRNAEAQASFAAAPGADAGGPADNAFVAHMVNRREAEMIWREAVAEGEFSGELLVHTSAGIRRHHVEISTVPGETPPRLIMSERPVDRTVAATLVAEGDERRFRDFAQAASDWFWEVDAELRFTYMSDSIHAPSARLTAAFLGRRIGDLQFGDFDKIDWSGLVEELRERRPFRDFRFMRVVANGAVRHLSVSGVPLFDNEGNFRGYRGIGRDITRQVSAEALAAAAQARLVDAIESIPACLVLLDAEDRVVLCNSRYRELHRSIEDKLAPGTPFADLCRASAEAGFIPAAVGRVDAWLADRLERHRSFGTWTEERQAKGRWFQLTERPTAEGGIVLVQVDVTDLKRREQELAEKTGLLQATLDNMEQGLLVLDRDLRIRAWNDRFITLLDLPPDAPRFGRPIVDIFRIVAERGEYGPGDPETAFARPLEQLARLDPPMQERVRPDGTIIEQYRVRMPDGGILVTYTDTTQRKRVEADLRRAKDEAELASRSKTEFLANMSHELRTPLNAIIGFSDVLMGEIFGALGDRRYHDYARDIRDSGYHLLNLINDVLDVAKIEFGRIELAEEALAPAEVVDACVRLMRERADAAEVALVTEMAPDLPMVRADTRRLKQIVINLLSNAVKFTPAGGCVTIAVSADAAGLLLTVSDTGIGIAAEDIEIALTPFGQIDSRLARKYQGTGLGLPLTKTMVELHGGTLELMSTPGHGTTARVRLPVERILAPAAAQLA